jgi:hypothetical protein
MLLTILLYFFASVFIVIGFMMLFAYWRSRRWELVLMSFVYTGSGLTAGTRSNGGHWSQGSWSRGY